MSRVAFRKRLDEIELALAARGAPKGGDCDQARARIDAELLAWVAVATAAREAGKPIPERQRSSQLDADRALVEAWERAHPKERRAGFPPVSPASAARALLAARWSNLEADLLAGLERGERQWPGRMLLAYQHGAMWSRKDLRGLERLVFAELVLNVTGRAVSDLPEEPLEPDQVQPAHRAPAPAPQHSQASRTTVEMMPDGYPRAARAEQPLLPGMRAHPEDEQPRYGGRWPAR